MNIIFSTQSVVEYDGNSYYSNAVQATYRRYLCLGDKITIICFKKDVAKASNDLIDEGAVTFSFVKKINTFKSLIRRDAKKDEKKIEQLVKRADLCVAHVPCEHSYNVIKYSKKYNKPYMTVVCGCPWDSLWNFDWRGKLLAPKAYLTLKRIQRESPFSIYVTNSFLQNRYPTKGQHIACSNVNISTGLSGILEKRLEFINNHQSGKEVYRIGTVAAIDVPYKGQEYVIRALAQLKEKGIVYEYHLVGTGSNTRLEMIAKEENVYDQVFFHGQLPHGEVLKFLDEIDIYVQPSKQEGLPRAMIEAMSRGCLCMGSRIAGIPELLEPHYLFSKGNVREISAILQDISSDNLTKQAIRNFEKAKEYDKDTLNKRRTDFLLEFKRKSQL